MEFRKALVQLKGSSAWKKTTRILTKLDLERREGYMGANDDKKCIEGARKEYQSNHFFMCQLPESLEETVNHYDEEPSKHATEPTGCVVELTTGLASTPPST